MAAGGGGAAVENAELGNWAGDLGRRLEQVKVEELRSAVTSHLSKGTSDFKQKCTQLVTPFWGTVFHALSHGMIHFVRSVRSRNHFLIG